MSYSATVAYPYKSLSYSFSALRQLSPCVETSTPKFIYCSPNHLFLCTLDFPLSAPSSLLILHSLHIGDHGAQQWQLRPFRTTRRRRPQRSSPSIFRNRSPRTNSRQQHPHTRSALTLVHAVQPQKLTPSPQTMAASTSTSTPNSAAPSRASSAHHPPPSRTSAPRPLPRSTPSASSGNAATPST